MKRLLAGLLSLCIMISSFPTAAFAQGEPVDGGKTSEIVETVAEAGEGQGTKTGDPRPEGTFMVAFADPAGLFGPSGFEGKDRPNPRYLAPGSLVENKINTLMDSNNNMTAWFYTDGQGVEYRWNFAEDTVSGDVTLYPKWVPSCGLSVVDQTIDGADFTIPMIKGADLYEIAQMIKPENEKFLGYSLDGVNVATKDELKAVILDETKTLYGIWEGAVAPEVENVAEVGGKGYPTLGEAIANAESGKTVVLLKDVEQADGIVIENKNVVIDLNGKKFTVTEGASTNNRNFKIIGTSVVTIKNGTMIAAGEYSSGAYGTVRTEGSANVTLTGLKLYNYRANGLNIKAVTGTTVSISETEIYSQYGGGIESAGGTITVADSVKVVQKGMHTAPYNSMAISVNGGGTVTVNGGTYSTECLTAEEANNQGSSHGPWVVGVLNSGGKLVINGGTFSNDNFGENSLATAARGMVLADTGAVVEINGGKFTALKKVVDIQNNLGDATRNPVVKLKGGEFSANPTDGNISNCIKLEKGYKVVESNGVYTLVDFSVAAINDEKYETLAAAFENAKDGDTITMLKDAEVNETITVPANVSVVFDMNGHKITSTDAKTSGNFELFYILGGMEVTGNGEITLTATTNREWNAMSVIFHNRGGNLVITNGTFTHAGGTDMAYVVDNSANSFGDAYTEVNGGTLSSTYTVIRNRLEKEGENGGGNGIGTVVVNGGELHGGKRSVWTQISSAPTKGTTTINGGELTGQLYSSPSSQAETMLTINGGTIEEVKAEAGKLTVKGGEIGKVIIVGADGTEVEYIVTESGKYIKASPVMIGEAGFETLAAAFENAKDGDTIKILKDAEVNATITVPDGISVVLDMNGHKITSTDTKASGNFELFYILGGMKVTGNGEITMSATTNRGWGGMSLIFHNRGGNLVVENGTFTHTGGTDMAFIIDNSTNSFGDVYTEVNGGTLSSTYTAIRNQLNGKGANGTGSGVGTIVINGGNIHGDKRSIWSQISSTSDVPERYAEGTVAINGGNLTGLLYSSPSAKSTTMFTINGGTVEDVKAQAGKLTVNGGTIGGTVTITDADGNTIKHYVNPNGVYLEAGVASVNGVHYYTLKDAFENAKDGDTITLLEDLEVNETITVPDGVSVVFDMNGHKITSTDAKTSGNYDLFYIFGGMEVTGNGEITLTATTNREWNAMSVIFHNRGGNLVITNGTFTHAGGTDMAYVVDNSANSFGDAYTEVNGGKLSSTYTVIRNRLEKEGENGGGNGIGTVVVNGGELHGGKRSVWTQISSAPTKGTTTINGGVLIGQLYSSPSSQAETMLTINGGIIEEVKAEAGKLTVKSGLIDKVIIVDANGVEVDYKVNSKDVYVKAYPVEVGEEGFETLAAAVAYAQPGDTIKLMKDIELPETVLIDKSVTIEGNGKTVTTAAKRAFRITTSDIEVVMNDVNIVSTALSSYTEDIRGISIDVGLEDVELTLNESSIKFDPISGSDWAYAVNICGETTDITLNINDGVYEGANVINVWGNGHDISIKDAELTSLYVENELYYGACVRLEGTGSEVTLENVTFTGEGAVSVCTTTAGANTVEHIGNTYVDVLDTALVNGESYKYLENAFAAAKGETLITLVKDVEFNKTITIPADVYVTFDMNGHKITSTDTKTSGNYELFYIYGALEVTGNGEITLTATTDRDWNAMSVIFHNRGGELYIGDGKFTHAGGTDMAYVIDNSTNSYGDAYTEVNGGTLSSTYTAIRNRLDKKGENGGGNGVGIVTINNGTITGGTSAYWAQLSSTPAEGHLTINGGNIGVVNSGRGADSIADVHVTGGEVEAIKVEVNELTVTGGTVGKVTTQRPDGTEVRHTVTESGLYIEADLKVLFTYEIVRANQDPEVVVIKELALKKGEKVEEPEFTLDGHVLFEDKWNFWELDEDGNIVESGEWLFDEYVIENDTEIRISYIPILTIAFDVQGIGKTPEAVKIPCFSGLKALPELSAQGYDFGGWYYEKECINPVDVSDKEFTENTTLYAKWIKHNYATITAQPKNVLVGEGEIAKISFTATGDGLKYVWYHRNIEEPEFSKTYSFKGNSYEIEMNAYRDGREYYCVVTDKYGNSVQTDIVTVSMKHVAKVVKQPADVTVAEGKVAKVSFTATGDGLKYAWYHRNTEETEFSRTYSFNGNSYEIEMNAYRSGREVYCVITDKYGNSVKTETVTINMMGKLQILVQPQHAIAVKGEMAKISFVATGDGLKYAWYQRNVEEAEFSRTYSFNGNSYQMEMNEYRDGREVYCIVTDKYGNSIKTQTVTINLMGQLQIIAQPHDVNAVNGGTAKVSFRATGDGLTYTWYYKNANSTYFVRTDTFKGNTYEVEMNSARTGRQVYCIVTDKYGNSVKTDIVTLGMKASIGTQPVSVTVASGKTAKVTLAATGDGLTYTWYYKDAGKSTFSKTDTFKGNVYSIAMNSTRNGRQVYCVVTDKYGNSVKSNTVTLKMK